VARSTALVQRQGGHVRRFLFRLDSAVRGADPAAALEVFVRPRAATDMYRDCVYHGGILAYKFWCKWSASELDHPRMESWCLKTMGEEKYREGIEHLLQNDEIAAIPELVEVLKNPLEGRNPLIVDLLLNPTDESPYWTSGVFIMTGFKCPLMWADAGAADSPAGRLSQLGEAEDAEENDGRTGGVPGPPRDAVAQRSAALVRSLAEGRQERHRGRAARQIVQDRHRRLEESRRVPAS